MSASQPGQLPFRFLATDGTDVYFENGGTLQSLTQSGQLAFFSSLISTAVTAISTLRARRREAVFKERQSDRGKPVSGCRGEPRFLPTNRSDTCGSCPARLL